MVVRILLFLDLQWLKDILISFWMCNFCNNIVCVRKVESVELALKLLLGQVEVQTCSINLEMSLVQVTGIKTFHAALTFHFPKSDTAVELRLKAY